MATAPDTTWTRDFGIEDRRPPDLFLGEDDLSPDAPQAHVLRRAFGQLQLDGVLCSDNSPLIYFKRVERIDPAEVHELNRRFWNHGGAPILVLIAPGEVQVHSGLCRPAAGRGGRRRPPSLVTVIGRVASALQAFLTAVESGEFFRRHVRSFDPDRRVDRDLLDNLKDTREKLDEVSSLPLAPQVLDALLCRLVFTCYLFDRGVIGQKYLSALGLGGAHLRDILALGSPDDAKSALYLLFTRLGEDFNGDLFSDDLEAEAALIAAPHMRTLDGFFRGTKVRSGQAAFWPYDFGIIPIETISAIYERFLKAADQKAGAFYTPRFLAEIVLDSALGGFPSLLGRKFFDPACGSGIFLVGLFNRMAEEWRQANPAASNERRARELMRLLREGLFGVDINPTACRITAFSLYLAYLDQLAPRDIQDLQRKGRALPTLVVHSGAEGPGIGNIRCEDFFSDGAGFPDGASLVIGNPPWSSTATPETPAGRWCKARGKAVPDMQIAAAFAWKAAEHVSEGGRICFVLPHGLLFHFSPTAREYQKAWLGQHTIERVLNLADFRWFLFEKAVHPAVVVSYRASPPADGRHSIEYWAPKADWTVTQAEIIPVSPLDQSTIRASEVLRDLEGPDAPQIWKQRMWATPRDLRLLDRLSLYPRLREHVRQGGAPEDGRPWRMAVGFQPFGENDLPGERKLLDLPSRMFVSAKSGKLDLFLLERDCLTLPSAAVEVRRLIRNTDIFRAPHVLVAKGFTNACYCDFDVSFQDALRGISGPAGDRELLMFLAAYLRTSLARYFLFHTSSDWGMARQQVHVEEMLRLPMPLPDQHRDPRRAREIVAEVAQLLASAARGSGGDFADRDGIVRVASDAIEPLVEEYFEVLPLEKILIDDAANVIIPSVQPTHGRMPVPTVVPITPQQLDSYGERVCKMLAGWAKGSGLTLTSAAHRSDSLGVAMVVIEKRRRPDGPRDAVESDDDLLAALARLRRAAMTKHGTLLTVRGVMLFERDRLYLVKPIGQRYWTETAALNDADEIAGTILMQPRKGHA